MGRAKPFWAVAVGIGFLVVSIGNAPTVRAGSVGGTKGTLAAPRTVNVSHMVKATQEPGYVAPTRRPLPALALPKSPRSLAASTVSAPTPVRTSIRPRVALVGPLFEEKVAFPGMAYGSDSTSEPPDPWVAVGPNHVVQAVNTEIRFSTRAGAEIGQVSMASFFLEPSTQVLDSDPRVLYDSAHGRWVASEVSADCSSGHLRFAVSATDDPTASWYIWDLAFAGSLPDYPGMGMTSDKIVFTANNFVWDSGTCSGGAFTAAGIYALDWSAVLGGGGAVSYTSWTSGAGVSTWRAAANLTADATAHLVAMGASGQVLYGAITGTNTGGDLSLTTLDLTTAGVVAAFQEPPVPEDPLGPIGPQAVDSRPTDALWQAGHLWFVSTYPYTYDFGATYRDVVRITELQTAGGVTLKQDGLLGDYGFDAYMGGIGLTQAGAMFAVYTESNASNNASLESAYQGPTSPPNQIDDYRQLVAGQAGYQGSRWGDYVGVATDPIDPNAVWQADEYANSSGSWSTRVSMLRQFLAPAAPSGVSAVAGNASARVTWVAPGDDGGSPITGYTATSSPGGLTCATTGAVGCMITGLTSGVPYTFTVTAANGIGTSPASVASSPVTPTTPPVPPSAAIASLPLWTTSTSLSVRWSSIAGTSPVVSYDVRYRRAAWNGSFGALATWRGATSSTSATFGASTGATYCFSVRARDAGGGLSGWTGETCTAIPLDDRSLARSSGWTAGTGTAYYRSTYLRSSSYGARLVRTSVRARRIAIVATTCSTCGSVRVYWGSTLLRTISLRSTATVNRKILSVADFGSTRSGTLTIKVYSSGRRALIDGLVIRQN